jgi:glutaredoxin
MYVVYGLPLCGECQRVKDELRKRGAVVIERDGRLAAERADANKRGKADDWILLAAVAQYHLQGRTFPVIIEVRSVEMSEV